MAKAPRLGRVKTRLAHDIGRVPAWSFYRRTLARVLRPLATDPRWTLWLAVAPDVSKGQPRVWSVECRRLGQGGGGLGQRMARMFTQPPPGATVMIGADIPAVRPHHIWRAFRALEGRDAVFGPADDGGYWLVGLGQRRRRIDIFANVRWSTEDALADTMANVPPHWRIATIDTLADVDDGAGYADHLLEDRKIGAMTFSGSD